MRTRNSIINVGVAIANNILTFIVGYIMQIIFVRTLGAEYLGVNGLFSNIIALLGLVELGIGTTIVFHLYKPVAENNKKKISALTNYYRKCYNVIALVVLAIGLFLMPFLPYIVGKVSIPENLNIIYILILSEVVVSYLLSYKRTILYVNQKDYISNIFHIVYTIFMNITEVIILFKTKNYILYLLIKTIFKMLENIVISMYVDRKYKYLKENRNVKIDKNTKNDITKKIKAMFTHKIGAYIVNGTDNILLSKLFGVVAVGLYSNYYLITYSVSSLLSQIFNSVKASVGNLLALEEKNKWYEIYKKLNFFNFWIYSLCAIGFCVVAQQYITFSYGKNYLFPTSVIIAITYNFFLQGMRQSINVYKEAAGIFYEDRFIPIIESIVNIVLSIIFGKIFGVIGIFLGTICSNLVLHLYSYPKYVYTKIFEKKYFEYIWILLKKTILMTVVLVPLLILNKLFSFNNTIYDFFIKGIITFIVVNLVYFIIYRKTDEYKYFKYLIVNTIKRKKVR